MWVDFWEFNYRMRRIWGISEGHLVHPSALGQDYLHKCHAWQICVKQFPEDFEWQKSHRLSRQSIPDLQCSLLLKAGVFLCGFAVIFERSDIILLNCNLNQYLLVYLPLIHNMQTYVNIQIQKYREVSSLEIMQCQIPCYFLQ